MGVRSLPLWPLGVLQQLLGMGSWSSRLLESVLCSGVGRLDRRTRFRGWLRLGMGRRLGLWRQLWLVSTGLGCPVLPALLRMGPWRLLPRRILRWWLLSRWRLRELWLLA